MAISIDVSLSRRAASLLASRAASVTAVTQVEVSDLTRRLVRKSAQLSTRRRSFARRSLIAFRTSSRTPTRASPKRLRIVCAPNFHKVDDLDAILAKLAGRRHRLRGRGL